MPYIIVRGNLASYDNKYPWRVLVSGLKAEDIESLNRFSCGGYCDECTIVYLQHPCVILSALEVLGYQVVASSSTSVKQDYNEYMWTMKKDLYDPEQDLVPIKDKMSHSHPDCKNHICACTSSSVVQTLEELDFERGIWAAARDGDKQKLMKLLLITQVDPDKRDSAGYTALHYSARNGHLDISRILLNNGANVNATTRAGNATALHRAVSVGDEVMVKLLIEYTADATIQDVDGYTALHRAIINKHSGISTMLMSKFPKLSHICDKKGKLPADYKT